MSRQSPLRCNHKSIQTFLLVLSLLVSNSLLRTVVALALSGPVNIISSPSPTPSDEMDHLLTLCYASSLSYLPIESILSSDYAVRVPGLKPILQVMEPRTESGATVFEVQGDGDALIVACRGSATVRNFATNLRFGLRPVPEKFDSPNARCHEGFQEAAEGLWERLGPHLLGGEAGEKKRREILFTGHSLGGGTAEICALHAASDLAAMTDQSSLSARGGRSATRITEVTTFGGPRIGDAGFAQCVNEGALLSGATIRHLVHGADPILANNNPLWDRLGFVRSGAEIRCDPFKPRILAAHSDVDNENRDVGVSRVPWNIADHCRYLGIYLGPRLL